MSELVKKVVRPHYNRFHISGRVQSLNYCERTGDIIVELLITPFSNSEPDDLIHLNINITEDTPRWQSIGMFSLIEVKGHIIQEEGKILFLAKEIEILADGNDMDYEEDFPADTDWAWPIEELHLTNKK